MDIDKLLWELGETVNKLENQLAEKEKEIKELKKDLELRIERLSRSINKWVWDLEGIAFQLGKTRSIFKSKTIAGIRSLLEEIIKRIIQEKANEFEKFEEFKEKSAEIPKAGGKGFGIHKY